MENKMNRENGRSGSFKLGLGMNEAKVHTVVELSGFDKKNLLDNYEEESREKQKTFTNSLSSRQMKSLVSLCDTILPSIIDNNVVASNDDEYVHNFYRTSASMAGTHERLGNLISEKLNHPSKKLLTLTLWLLSTWFGTLILCGKACMSTKFPFFHSFPQMSSEKRQKVLQGWSHSYFLLLRMFFRTIKLLTLLVFFTQVDEEKNNPSWKAIGEVIF